MNDYQRFVIQEPILLRTFLAQHVSGRALKKLKYQGGIVVNGVARTVRFQLSRGDVVELFYPDERSRSRIVPWYFPLHIVYQDDYLLVVNKPAGLPSIPNRHYPDHTLANALMGYFEMNQIPSTVHLISRLDKDTSGLILVAKSQRLHALLNQQFERRYLLLVEGQMTGKGVIDQPIGRHPETLKRMVMAEGKKAITRYRVWENRSQESLVEARLETGRTHQIRVHFSYLGYPLVGDRLYGKACPGWSGQALHSYYLAFEHPITHEQMVFQDIPPAFLPTHFPD